MHTTIGFTYLSIALIACGGSVVVGEAGGGSSSAQTTTGSGGASATSTSTNAIGSTNVGVTSTGAGGSVYVNCPQTAPNGGPCSMEGLECSYGDEIPANCRQVFDCQNGSWLEQPGSVCSQMDCPAQVPASMSACASEGTECGYPDGTICQCSDCNGGGLCQPQPMPEWYCGAPPTTPGCPAIEPNEGTACSQENLDCSYSPSCSAPLATCMNGVWTWEEVACAG